MAIILLYRYTMVRFFCVQNRYIIHNIFYCCIISSCSGVRYLLSYVVFGVAYAFRFNQSFKARALVVLCAVPLSIAGGVLRLSVIFSTAYYIGPFMVEHRPHGVLSWTVFTVLLVSVIAIDRHLSRKNTIHHRDTEVTEK